MSLSSLIVKGSLFCFVRARAHVRALMTQKSCAVGIRNAKLGNHLNVSVSFEKQAKLREVAFRSEGAWLFFC